MVGDRLVISSERREVPVSQYPLVADTERSPLPRLTVEMNLQGHPLRGLRPGALINARPMSKR